MKVRVGKIFIDPGHGGSDPGAVGPGNRLEKDDNLRYAKKLRDILTARGIECVMTREGDTRPSYGERCAMEKGCDLAICCHRNGAAAQAARGVEIWLHHSVAAGGSIVKWAQDTAEGLRAVGFPLRSGMIAQGVYRGFRTDPAADYYCNSGTSSPSMLIELGFVTNAEDNALFDQKIGDLAKAIADAACRKLGVGWDDEAENEESSNEVEQLKAEILLLKNEVQKQQERYRELSAAIRNLADEFAVS